LHSLVEGLRRPRAHHRQRANALRERRGAGGGGHRSELLRVAAVAAVTQHLGRGVDVREQHRFGLELLPEAK
jgi:hypothetical protein